jgi:YHS domain-containing protein
MVRGVSRVHDGREIKFCCGECEWSFLENPGRYLKKLEER